MARALLDSGRDTGQSLAGNPSIPRDVARSLLRSEPDTRQALAPNPAIPGDVQAGLIGDAEPTRAALAGNTALTCHRQQMLLSDADPLIRVAVTANPNLSSELPQQLMDDPHDDVRLAAARQRFLKGLTHGR